MFRSIEQQCALQAIKIKQVSDTEMHVRYYLLSLRAQISICGHLYLSMLINDGIISNSSDRDWEMVHNQCAQQCRPLRQYKSKQARHVDNGK